MPDRAELARLAKEAPVNPESLAIRSQQAGHLRTAIQRLPPQYRIILVLRDMEGLSDDEVAEITGLRPGTVRVRLHRARLFVRKELVRTTANGNSSRITSAHRTTTAPVGQPRPRSCKTLFAQLSNYLDEQLDDSLCENLEQHLDGCEPCKAFLATLESTIEQLRAVLPESFDEVSAAKLRRDLLSQFPYSASSKAHS